MGGKRTLAWRPSHSHTSGTTAGVALLSRHIEALRVMEQHIGSPSHDEIVNNTLFGPVDCGSSRMCIEVDALERAFTPASGMTCDRQSLAK